MSGSSWAALWKQWAQGPGEAAFHHHRERLQGMLPSSGRVLDAGCGDGRFTRELLGNGCQAVGLDRSHELCVAATQRSGSSRFVVGDLHGLPFGDQSFDCVVSIMVLQELPRVLPVLREFRRVLRSGGQLVLAVSHPYSTTLGRLDSGQLVVIHKYGSGEPYSRVAAADGMSIVFSGFQHSVEEYFHSLCKAGFQVESLGEVTWASSDHWCLLPRYLHVTASAIPGPRTTSTIADSEVPG
jgi:SAM-dependent methyltransferase